MGAVGKPASDVAPIVVDLETKVGLLRPIPTGGLCLTCHGDENSLSPDVAAALRKRYPADRATGFKEGDVRGFFWAEVPKAGSSRSSR